jgi:hypothetical protein
VTKRPPDLTAEEISQWTAKGNAFIARRFGAGELCPAHVEQVLAGAYFANRIITRLEPLGVSEVSMDRICTAVATMTSATAAAGRPDPWRYVIAALGLPWEHMEETLEEMFCDDWPIILAIKHEARRLFPV